LGTSQKTLRPSCCTKLVTGLFPRQLHHHGFAQKKLGGNGGHIAAAKYEVDDNFEATSSIWRCGVGQ